MDRTRYEELQLWMFSQRITLASLGSQISLTSQGARRLLVAESIPTKRHKQLVALGFPVDLLPIPLDLPTGPRPKVPNFPVVNAENLSN